MKKFPALVLIVFAAVTTPCFAQIAPLPKANDSTIGYKTVADALAALQANPNIQISVQGGWTIASDNEAKTIWSFAPQNDPSYPSAVRRIIEEHDGSVFINMKVLCQAPKAACDQLVSQFEQLNDRMSQSMRNQPN